jgi:hypothetical protein
MEFSFPNCSTISKARTAIGCSFSPVLHKRWIFHSTSPETWHIFAVELFFANAVSGNPKVEVETLPSSTLHDLFGIGERAAGIYREFLAQTKPESWAEVTSSVVDSPLTTEVTEVPWKAVADLR